MNLALPELPKPVRAVVVMVSNIGSTHKTPGKDYYTADQMRAYAEQAVAADRAARGVPDGFVLVPKVPTNSMTSEMANALEDPENERSSWDLAENMYRAMLAAAPQPAAQPEQSLCGHCGRQVTGGAWPIKPAAQPAPSQTVRTPMTRDQAINLVERVRMQWATSPPTYEIAPAVIRAVEAWHGIKDAP